MSRKNIMLVVVMTALILLSSCTKEKQGVKISLISFIDHPIFNTIVNSFKNELRNQLDSAYNYTIIENNAQGNIDNLPFIATQVMAAKPDIIVPISTPVTQAFMRVAEPNTKIIYTFVSDTLNLGDALRVTNSTGLSDVINYEENLDLIQKIKGDKVVVGIIYNPNEANSVKGIREIKKIADAKKINIVLATVMNESEIGIVSSQMVKSTDVILSIGDNTVGAGLKIVIDNANKFNKPVFAIDEGSIQELGAVGGVSVDYEKLGRETAKIVADVIINKKNPKSMRKVLLYGKKLLFNRKVLNKLNLQLPDDVEQKAEFVN